MIKFKVRGNLRFLSHAETVRVFQRACVRAGIKIQHSQGFNPRPKLSLPLPRAVGVETDDDLLSLRVQLRQQAGNQSKPSASSFDGGQFKARLSGQLPGGIKLLSVTAEKAKASFQPCAATYVFAVRQEYLDEKLKAAIERLLASESLNLQRRIDARGNTRNVDVRDFLKSIELDGKDIVVECKISPAGSIRVDEILKLLELDIEKLAAPIRRTNVKRQSN